MITKIALKNFMSHQDTVLELGPGLTVVTGPNNCGKSALVAALQVICRNHLGDLVVRHGEKECSVTIWTDDPHEITWRRKGKDVSYTIDGVEYGRLKGKTPEVLHDLLRLPEIEEGEETFDLHFGLQKEPIFLLDEAGSKAAKFFAASSDAARLMAMQALHKRRIQERKSTLKTLMQQEEQYQAQLERLSPIDAIRVELREAEEAYRFLSAALGQEEGLARSAQRLLDQDCEAELHSQRFALLTALPPVPDFAPTDELEEWLLETERAQDQLQYQTAKVKACEPLDEPERLVDASALQSLVKALGQVALQYESLSQQATLYRRLPESLQQENEVLLSNFVRKLEGTKDALTDAVGALAQVQQAGDQAKRQLKRWMEENPECPVCQRPWEESALLVGGHAHG